MFSFIKWFGSLMENAKKKKGLWFTLLTTFSLIGIFISLYFVNFLVSDVAKKTFENQKNHYVLSLKNQINMQNEYTESLAIMMSKNADIANYFFSNDFNATAKIKAKSDQIANSINTILGKKQLSISYQRVEKKRKKVGIHIGKKGALFQGLVPMLDNNGTMTAVVIDKRIDTLVDHYKKEGKVFAFLLNESGIHKVDRALKKHAYSVYHEKYYLHIERYDKSFTEALKGVDFSGKLEENGYFKDGKYFYVYEKMYDIEGDYIGLAFVGEQIKNDNSFVNLVKNLVNSVTMVALGLIVSMLLFLF